MQTLNMPHCCTAKVIVDFGESSVAEGGAHPITEEEISDYIKSSIKAYHKAGYATLIAITNDEQKTANEVLRKQGFKYSKWMKKRIHKETKMRLWWLPLY